MPHRGPSPSGGGGWTHSRMLPYMLCSRTSQARRQAEEYEYLEVAVMRHSPTCRVVQRMSGARRAELLRRNGGENICTTQHVSKLRPWQIGEEEDDGFSALQFSRCSHDATAEGTLRKRLSVHALDNSYSRLWASQ